MTVNSFLFLLKSEIFLFHHNIQKKSLYYPETYDPTETVVDSAFTPFDDPLFYKAFKRRGIYA